VVEDFTSEDDLNTFEGWMKHQGFDGTARMAPDALEIWRGLYDEMLERKSAADHPLSPRTATSVRR